LTTSLALLSIGCALIYPLLTGEGLARAMVKSGAVGALASVALISGAPMLAVALALSTWGDFALARPGDRWFLAGMVGFGLAHVLYAILFITWGALAGLTGWAMGAACALACLAAWLGHRFSAQAGELKWPVRIYVGLIAIMGVAALGLPVGIVLLGALLFVLSDAMIGQQKFLNTQWPGQDLAIWVTYYLAQVCILVGTTGTYQFL